MLRGISHAKFKVKFIITNDAQESFHDLRQAFITAHLLHHSQFLVSIQIETDTSGFAILAILFQSNTKLSYQEIVGL